MLTPLLHAWRSWKNAKGIAVLAILALTLGIGATTAMFSFVNGLLLRPLPYPHGERYLFIFAASTKEPDRYGSSTFRNLQGYRDQTQSFDTFGWYQTQDYIVTSPGAPQIVHGARVTPALVNGLEVRPHLGQWFQDDAGVMLSYGFWQRMGADPSIVGKPYTLAKRVYTVTGVMGPDFALPFEQPEISVWTFLDPTGKGQDARSGANFCYARRKPGVSEEQARADVARVAALIAASPEAPHRNYTARVDPLTKIANEEIRPAVLLLFATAAVLLLLTCANVAGLFLSRSVGRARETALRVALGASRRQLAAQFLLEGSALAIPAMFGAVAIAIPLVRGILAMAGKDFQRGAFVTVDWRAFAFAAATGFIATAIFSLAPLWQALRTQPAEALNDGVRASAGVRTRNLSRALVVCEIALAVTLLAGSAMMLLHLKRLTEVWVGFNPQDLITFSISVPDPILKEGSKRVPYQLALRDAIADVTGVEEAGWTSDLPLSGCCFGAGVTPNPLPPRFDTGKRMSMQIISASYFKTLGIAPRRGRLLENQDANAKLLRVVASETAAKFYWPNSEAVGATGTLGSSPFEVVGVIGDVKNDGIGKPPEPELYLLGISAPWQNMQFVVHTKRPPESIVPEIRAGIQKFDPELPIQNVSTMRNARRDALALEIVSSALTAFFAAAALLLSALGVYGVMAYSVRQRTVEFGTRMAMGATQRSVFELVTAAGLKMAALGIGIGIAGGFAIMPALRNVYGAGDNPPFEFIGVIVLVGAVAIAASAIPAWRATLVPPMAALRDEPEGFWTALRRSVKRFAASLEDKESPAISEQSLAEELTAASRNAKTFDEAINKAVDALRESMQATSAILLKRAGAVLQSETLSIPSDGFLTGRLRFLAMPLPMLPGDFDTWQRWAEANKPGCVEEIAALRNSSATLAIALRAKNEINGIVLLGGRDRFHFIERAIAARAAGQLALLIENAGLTSRIVEQEKLRKDVELATEVQRRLLPAQAPQTPMAQLAGLSIPARGVGGDYYDFIDYGDHKLGIAIADIAGKGVSAALIMSVVQATLRIVSSEEGIALPDLAARMNRLLNRSTQAKSYATFFYAQIDNQTNQLRYVNAGHNPPYLWRSENGEIVELPAGGTVIGLFPQMRYEEAAIGLQKGDVLIAFTDGVTEAMNPADEEYGEDRLKALLADVAKLPIDEMSARITAEMRGWIRDAEQYDDLTFVLMKVN